MRASLRPAWIFAVSGVLLTSVVALGDFGDDTGMLIPYVGYLEKDGVPVNTGSDTLQMRFTLYDAEVGGNACATTHTAQAQVSAGKFQVILGPLAESCILGKQVHVAVEVDDEGVFVALAGRSRVFPALAAMTSGTNDFYTRADAVIDGIADIAGGLFVGGSADVGGNITQRGSDFMIASVSRGDGGRAIVHDGSDTLALNYAGDFAGGTRIDSAVKVNGALDVTGNQSFGSTTRQMLNLYSTQYGLGVQSSTTYFRSGGNFGWYLGGAHSDAGLAPGAGGSTLMQLSSGGDLYLPSNSHNDCYDTGFECGRLYCGNGYFMAGLDIAENENCGGGGDYDFSPFSLTCCRL